NIGGQRSLPYDAFIALVAARLNSAVTQVKLPSWPFCALASAVQRAFHAAQVDAPDLVARWSQPILNKSVDIAKARAVLGFAPRPLEITVDETIEWFRRERML